MRIGEGAYRSIGGVSGALATRAEGLLGQLGDDAQEATRQVFLRLVTLGEGSNDTRRRVLQHELEDLSVDGRVLASVLDTFGRHRMLSFDRDPVTRGPTVEISHEAMLSEWDRLRDWIDGARHDVRNQRRLAEAMQEWRSAGEDEEYLLRGGRLDQLHGWATTTTLPLSLTEQAFLEASVAERDRADEAERDRLERTAVAERRARARTRQLALAGALGVVIAALAVFGIVQWRAADDKRAEAETAQTDAEAARADTDRQVRAAELQLASESLLADDPELALMLATAAVRETVPLGYATEEAVDAVHWALHALRIPYELDDETEAAVRSGPRGLTGVWVIAPAELVEHAEQSVERTLTAEECAAYFAGACPPRRALPPDLPLRFGEANYGIDPRVQGFYNENTGSGRFAPLAGTRVTLAAPFLSGDQGFANQLERFTFLTGIEVDLVASDVFDIVAVTTGRLDPTDVIAVPLGIPDWARPLALDVGFLGDDELREDFGDLLLDAVSDPPGPDGDRIIRALPMSLGLDTIVYYPKAAFAEAGYSVPATWSELIDLSQQMMTDGHAPWCVGYEAGWAGGFRGAQLVKTLVAGTTDAEAFAAWQAGDVPFGDPRIIHAGRLADELVLSPGFVRGGAASISSEPTGAELVRMFEGSDSTDPGCWLAAADDGMLRAVPSDVVLGVDLDYFFLPPIEGDDPPLMVVEPRYVSGLVDRPEVRALLYFMSRRSWGEEWAESLVGSAFIPAHRDFRVETVGLLNDPDDPAIAVRRRMMTEVRDAFEAGTIRLDQANKMPLAIGAWNERVEPGAFWQGILDWVDGRKTIEEVFADIDAAWAALRAADED
jgi:ABC-type glycerol-3-phosphate transport system substrate-binding protein